LRRMWGCVEERFSSPRCSCMKPLWWSGGVHGGHRWSLQEQQDVISGSRVCFGTVFFSNLHKKMIYVRKNEGIIQNNTPQ
jgi:hypothetical protein